MFGLYSHEVSCCYSFYRHLSECSFSAMTRLMIEEGREMRFVVTPTNKLPEALSAFDPLTGSLFTGKFFSAHRAIGENDSPMDGAGIEGWEEYVEDWGKSCWDHCFCYVCLGSIGEYLEL